MKTRPSRLDEHAATLRAWFAADKLSYAEAKKRLASLGCQVSEARLCDWWQREQRRQLADNVLERIVTGSRACEQMNDQFATNPAPQLSVIVNWLKTLVMQTAVSGHADAKLLTIAKDFLKSILDYEKLLTQREALNLDREKFEIVTCEKFLKFYSDSKAREIAETDGDNRVKIAALRSVLFAEVDAAKEPVIPS